MNNFLQSVVGSLIASAIVLLIDRQRLPKLAINMDNSGNISNSYPERGKWKFIRARVVNKHMPFLLRWLKRQTAENCSATVSLFNEGGEKIFSMRGRWSNTPELAFLPRDVWVVRVLHPDPIAIIEGAEQTLDVVVRKENDIAAFGWNNEAYLNDWRTPQYRLEKGKYKVTIDIVTQNGVSFTKTSDLEVGDSMETTFFK